jgi:RHS repeat-associated protein
VRTDFPDGTFETVAFYAWSETHADANDNVLESAWYATNEALPASDPRRQAAEATAAHAHTPAVRMVDPLGRTFLVVEDNGSSGKYETRTVLDIQGNALAVIDARGIVVLEQSFDLDQSVLAGTSADAGERRTLRDVAGNAIRSVDGRPFLVRTEYDRLRRPLRVYVTPPGQTEILAERLVYGEAVVGGGTADNVRGRKVLHYDGAGELYLSAYDFQGNLTKATRTLTVTYQKTPDWTPLALLTEAGSTQTTAAALLEPDSFTTITAYDALNRPISKVTPGPDPSTIVPAYDEASLLERVDVYVRGAAAATTFVAAVAYNAKGQREQIVYSDDGQGHGTLTTTYAYEPLTFRLSQLETTRAGDGAVLQNLAYTYDPVGNVTKIDDSAQQTVFFNNDVVTPSAAYVYDAVYRLISATGREQAGGNADVPRDQDDVPLLNLPDPNDVQKARSYAESYVYDAGGNLRQLAHKAINSPMNVGTWTQQYGVDTASNRLVGAQYSNDACGNMTSMPHLSTITWDWRNQMQSADLGGGGEVHFACDASGQRVRKVWEHSGLVEERIYVGEHELYRKRAASAATVALARETLHVMDSVRRIALVETTTADASAGGAFQVSTVMRFQLGNHLGSAVLEVDGGGKVISYEEYHPYGTTAYRSGTGAAEVSLKRYRYTGKERDEETGLYYHGARYYACWLGRWTSADPSGIQDGLNLYAYVHGNPIVFLDMTGREGVSFRIILRPALPGDVSFDLVKKFVDAARGKVPEPEPGPSVPGTAVPSDRPILYDVRVHPVTQTAGGWINGAIAAYVPGLSLVQMPKLSPEYETAKSKSQTAFGLLFMARGLPSSGGVGPTPGWAPQPSGAVALTPAPALAVQAPVGAVAAGIAAKELVLQSTATGGGSGSPPPSPQQGSGEAAGSGSGSSQAPTSRTTSSGTVVQNQLSATEKAFAEKIVAKEGGTLIGQTVRNQPGIDGTLNGVPISLKQTQGGLGAVLKHASTAEAKAARAGYSGVHLFIEAPNVESATLLDFASRGPLSSIPRQGTISEITVFTRNGWVTIPH